MRVKLECGRTGPAGAQDPGQVVNVPEAEGRRMIERGHAVPTTTEKQARSRPQTGAVRTGKPRG